MPFFALEQIEETFLWNQEGSDPVDFIRVYATLHRPGRNEKGCLAVAGREAMGPGSEGQESRARRAL